MNNLFSVDKCFKTERFFVKEPFGSAPCDKNYMNFQLALRLAILFFTKFTFQAYGQSKLANILFTKELARQVDENMIHIEQ